jgi:hypothetical protein
MIVDLTLFVAAKENVILFSLAINPSSHINNRSAKDIPKVLSK